MAKKLIISALGGIVNYGAHALAHAKYGEASAFEAAGVSEVGLVVGVTGFVGTWIALAAMDGTLEDYIDY